MPNEENNSKKINAYKLIIENFLKMLGKLSLQNQHAEDMRALKQEFDAIIQNNDPKIEELIMFLEKLNSFFKRLYCASENKHVFVYEWLELFNCLKPHDYPPDIIDEIYCKLTDTMIPDPLDPNFILRIRGKNGVIIDYTMLSYVANKSNAALVKALLERGADPNKILTDDKEFMGSRTPLFSAVMGSDVDTVWNLLFFTQSIDPNLGSEFFGNTPKEQNLLDNFFKNTLAKNLIYRTLITTPLEAALIKLHLKKLSETSSNRAQSFEEKTKLKKIAEYLIVDKRTDLLSNDYMYELFWKLSRKNNVLFRDPHCRHGHDFPLRLAVTVDIDLAKLIFKEMLERIDSCDLLTLKTKPFWSWDEDDQMFLNRFTDGIRKSYNALSDEEKVLLNKIKNTLPSNIELNANEIWMLQKFHIRDCRRVEEALEKNDIEAEKAMRAYNCLNQIRTQYPDFFENEYFEWLANKESKFKNGLTSIYHNMGYFIETEFDFFARHLNHKMTFYNNHDKTVLHFIATYTNPANININRKEKLLGHVFDKVKTNVDAKKAFIIGIMDTAVAKGIFEMQDNCVKDFIEKVLFSLPRDNDFTQLIRNICTTIGASEFIDHLYKHYVNSEIITTNNKPESINQEAGDAARSGHEVAREANIKSQQADYQESYRSLLESALGVIPAVDENGCPVLTDRALQNADKMIGNHQVSWLNFFQGSVSNIDEHKEAAKRYNEKMNKGRFGDF